MKESSVDMPIPGLVRKGRKITSEQSRAEVVEYLQILQLQDKACAKNKIFFHN